jgi:hypothetical protein
MGASEEGTEDGENNKNENGRLPEVSGWVTELLNQLHNGDGHENAMREVDAFLTEVKQKLLQMLEDRQ